VVATFVTTYRRSILTGKIGREKRERTKTEKKRRTNQRGMRKEKPRST